VNVFPTAKVPEEVNATLPASLVEQSTANGPPETTPVVIVHGFNVIEILDPLSLPVVAGADDITRIR
jgi:hypothetical protein